MNGRFPPEFILAKAGAGVTEKDEGECGNETSTKKPTPFEAGLELLKQSGGLLGKDHVIFIF